MTLPPWPPCDINFFEQFHFLTGDQLVVPIGASHIFLPLQEIQSREREKKEQTNNMLGLTQVQKGSYVTLCICRLTLAWISSENSTTLLECRLILTRLLSLLWTSSHPTGLSAPVSTGLSCHPLPTPFFEVLFPTLFSRSLTHFRSRRDFKSKPFVWFHAKTDKGIVCLVDHLHSVTRQPTWEKIRSSQHTLLYFYISIPYMKYLVHIHFIVYRTLSMFYFLHNICVSTRIHTRTHRGIFNRLVLVTYTHAHTEEYSTDYIRIFVMFSFSCIS